KCQRSTHELRSGQGLLLPAEHLGGLNESSDVAQSPVQGAGDVRSRRVSLRELEEEAINGQEGCCFDSRLKALLPSTFGRALPRQPDQRVHLSKVLLFGSGFRHRARAGAKASPSSSPA